jgi:hypothetical protein
MKHTNYAWIVFVVIALVIGCTSKPTPQDDVPTGGGNDGGVNTGLTADDEKVLTQAESVLIDESDDVEIGELI